MTRPAPAARGRPRDPSIEERVFDAALEVYAARGWSGFTLDAVARTAGVGNAAIYRRWTSKEELLSQAVHANALELRESDTGSSRDDLLELARHFLLGYHVRAGVAGLRMALDARTNPQLAEVFEAGRDGVRRTRALAVVRRALQRGDLRAGLTAGTALDVLAGATLSHVLYSPRSTGDHGTATPSEERFLERLVDGLLA
ncbi:MAG TPA: TetR/AcrR family transcriptional regulator [Mycobacteriales bacterium]|nr:TetR/AcrR family transcriptional regulator [Mycobacteriales bacterium]